MLQYSTVYLCIEYFLNVCVLNLACLICIYLFYSPFKVGGGSGNNIFHYSAVFLSCYYCKRSIKQIFLINT